MMTPPVTPQRVMLDLGCSSRAAWSMLRREARSELAKAGGK